MRDQHPISGGGPPDPLACLPPLTGHRCQRVSVSGLKPTIRGFASAASVHARRTPPRISRDPVTLARLTITPAVRVFAKLGKNSRRSIEVPTSTFSDPLKTTSLELMLSTHPSRHLFSPT